MEKSINLEGKKTASGIKLDERVECIEKALPDITLKGHQGNFGSAHSYPLINLCKSAVEKVCKSILEISGEIRTA